jgi:site-specific DNA-methyltransferase (adenine-specific)
VYCGDAANVAARQDKDSINCIVTSPPYFWQRDYGVAGQIGVEPTVAGYVGKIVEVFREIRPALRGDGVVFLNLGDGYYNKKGRPHGRDAKHTARDLARDQLRAVDGPGLGYPRKTLLGIPWRVALAMVDDGWTLRSEIIWVRRNAMPEPTALDRPWRHHEQIFMFSKSPRYYFDRTAVGAEEDVWLINPERSGATRGLHYAPYPEELVRRCVAMGCPAGGTVLDPFAGGGTTLSVANDLGMNAIGFDLNPDFCELMAARLSGSLANGSATKAPRIAVAS